MIPIRRTALALCLLAVAAIAQSRLAVYDTATGKYIYPKVGTGLSVNGANPNDPYCKNCTVDATAGPGGASLPITPNLLKGDNAGGAAAAVPGSDFQQPLGFTPENIANKNQPSGYVGIGSDGFVDPSRLGSGGPDASKVLYGDKVWRLPPSGAAGSANVTEGQIGGVIVTPIGSTYELDADPAVVPFLGTANLFSNTNTFIGVVDASAASRTFPFRLVTADQSGACANANEVAQNSTNGTLFGCVAGSWAQLGGGAPAAGSAVQVLHKAVRVTVNTANSAAIVYSYSVPSLGAGKCIRAQATVAAPESAGFVYSYFTFGGSAGPSQRSQSSLAGRAVTTAATFCNVAGSQVSQDVSYELSTFGDNTAAVNTASAFNVELWVSTDTAATGAKVKSFVVEELP